MENNWRLVTVEQIKKPSENSLATGPFGSSISSRFFVKSGIPVIRGSNLSERVGERLIEDEYVFIEPKKAEEFRRSVVKCGDLIFTSWGTINQVGLIDEYCRYPEYIISNKQMKFTPDPDLADSLFLYYLFSSPKMQEKILAEGIGSSVPGFNLGQLRNIEINLPPLPTQYAISRCLNTFDKKIQLNGHINRTLELIAQSVFKSWFIDFNPVQAKAKGKRPFGMDEETAALFPSELENSNLGMIPKGWSVRTLEESITAEKGLSYKGDFLSESEGVPMHNLNSVHEGGGYKYEGIKYYTGKYKQRHILCAGDIIVTNTEQGFDYLLIGYPAIVPNKFGSSGIFSHHIFRVQPKLDSTLKAHFLYYLLMAPFVREQIIACTNGTTVNMLSIDGLKSPRFILPPPELIERFEKMVLPIFEKIEANQDESETLASLRDALLPKLLSGDIRITT